MSTTIQAHPADAELPQLSASLYISDGGLETTLVFLEQLDLADFAAFPLLDDIEGRRTLDRYYAAYIDVARDHDVGIVLDTPTWRANADWGPRLGYDPDALAAANERAVEYVRAIASDNADVPSVVNGVIGPRGDGYVVGDAMTADEATRYHSLQARAFGRSGADLITAVTMTYVDEAVGVVRAARAAGLPVAIGFTTETDGRLPSGTSIGDAIEAVDAATEGAAAYFMVNCAHPSHFRDAFTEGADWLDRIKAVRANASRMSHQELDDSEELDRGDPGELAADYAELHRLLPDLRVVGGCCGTDHEHVAAITHRLAAR